MPGWLTIRWGDAVACNAFLGIFLLRIDEGEGGFDGVELIAPDAAGEYLLTACRRVELPAAVLAHQRDRERPLLVADDQHSLVPALSHDLMPAVVGFEHALAGGGIGDGIARRHDLATAWAEQAHHRCAIGGFGSIDECGNRVVGALEALLRRCAGHYKQQG